MDHVFTAVPGTGVITTAEHFCLLGFPEPPAGIDLSPVSFAQQRDLTGEGNGMPCGGIGDDVAGSATPSSLGASVIGTGQVGSHSLHKR